MTDDTQENITAGWNLRPGNRLQLTLTLLATGVMIWLFFRIAPPADILGLFKQIDVRYLLYAFLFYLLVYTSRTIRLQQFQQLRRRPVSELLPAVAFHSFLNFILPSRSGELTLIYFLKRYAGVDTGSGTGFLFVSRLYDLIAMTAFFLVSFFALDVQELGGLGPGIQWVAAAFLAVLILAAVLAGPIVQRFMGWLESRAGDGDNWSGRVLEKAAQWGWGIQAVFAESRRPGLSLALFVSSIFVWLGLNGIFWALMNGMGFKDLTVSSIVIAATLGALTSVLPLTLLGNWGTLQVGWTAGFVWAGLGIEDAVASGFAVQLWTLLFSTTVLVLNLSFRRFRTMLLNRSSCESSVDDLTDGKALSRRDR